MIVIALILMIMAALAVPNIVAYQRSASHKQLEANVARLPLEARNQAVLLQNPVSISVSGNTLVMQEQEFDTNPNSNTGSMSSNDSSTTLDPDNLMQGASGSAGAGATTQVQLKTIDLGTDMQVDSVQLNGQATDTGSWLWMAYPDGSSDTGAIQFSEGSVSKSLVMDGKGHSQWISGEMPDQSQDEWSAGQLETRS
jgi:Tfp pilus assembly protein FimT